MQISKPPRKKYLFAHLDEVEYRVQVARYQKCKKLGFRSVTAYLSGQGIVNLGWEIGKGQIKYYARRKFGVMATGAVSWIAGPIASMITNSTKVLKALKICHNTVSFCLETAEDVSCAWMAPIDMVCFGQLIPVGDENRFNIMTNSLDILED